MYAWGSPLALHKPKVVELKITNAITYKDKYSTTLPKLANLKPLSAFHFDESSVWR